ncbi:MAG: AAA family ATPase [Methylocystis sp.]|nr:AAA family ATPase [Rhodobacter sp.]MCA3583522.1 AAA family ATPase [Methylocystis sp.]MCA3461537.1 AAA family ATPase [Rhodobacter sp.]MCA3464463.1 AAA family ATPase [Rhodobacter sp.]MCA3466272.1 AAA family ATPase [Rhodobacter sp.]
MPNDYTPATPRDMRQTAFDLAAQGFKVFPLQPNGKLPHKGVSWKDLVCKDEFAAFDLWSKPQFRDSNIGIHCEGLIVVDLDRYKDGGFDQSALDALNLPPTRTVRTPGKPDKPGSGEHLYFSVTENVANSAGKIGAGIDVRGFGGYVVAPGSVRPEGEYVVTVDLPIAPAPQALIDRCKAAPAPGEKKAVDWTAETPPARVDDGRQYLATAPISIAFSEGNQTAFQACAGLSDRGIYPSAALDLLQEKGGWNDRCLPPWSEDELRQLIANAYTYAQNPFSCRAVDRVHGQAVIPETPAPAPRENIIMSGLFSFAEFAGQKAPPFEWLVPDIIPADNVTLLYGDGGTGKSLRALQLAVATVAGKEWIGHPVMRKGPVLCYSAEEAKVHMQARTEQVCAGLGVDIADLRDLKARSMVEEPDAAFATFDRDILKETTVWKDIVETVRAMKPTAMIVDTLADVFAGDEIKRVQARAFIALLRKLAMTENVTILLLAHPSQSGLSSNSGTSGSTAWSNSVRSRLYFRRDDPKLNGSKPDPDVRVLSIEKANYGPQGKTTTVRWVAGCFHRLADADAALRQVQAEAAFLACLRSARARSINVTDTGKGSAPNEFQNWPEATGFGVRDLQAAMERLMGKGTIRKMPYRNKRAGREQHRLEEVQEDGVANGFDPAAAFEVNPEPTAEHLANLAYTAIFEEQQIAADSLSATVDNVIRLDPSLDRFTRKELATMLRAKLQKPVEVKGAWVRYKAESNGKPGAPVRLIVIGGAEE